MERSPAQLPPPDTNGHTQYNEKLPVISNEMLTGDTSLDISHASPREALLSPSRSSCDVIDQMRSFKSTLVVPKENGNGTPTVLCSSRKRVQSRCARMIHDTWLWELSSVFLSITCFVAIVAILIHYDKKAPPKMRFGLTLNAIVAILSTVSKSSLLCAVAGAISQLKWNWFSKHRPLKDLQTFDDASRGPVGSVGLLFSSAAVSLASVGAIITVMTLSFDPFLQQVVGYSEAKVLWHAEATTQKATRPVGSNNTVFDWVVPLNAGVWAKTSHFDRKTYCPTGSCSWPAFQSLSTCSRCVDSTVLATISNCDPDSFISRPNNNSMEGTSCSVSVDGRWNTTITHAATHLDTSAITAEFVVVLDEVVEIQTLGRESDFYYNSSFAGLINPLKGYGYVSIYYNGYSENRVGAESALLNPLGLRVTKAEECALTYCLNDFVISTTNGVVHVDIVRTQYGMVKVKQVFSKVITPSSSPNGSYSKWLCWQPDSSNLTYHRPENSFYYVSDSEPYAFCVPSWYLSQLSDLVVGKTHRSFGYVPTSGDGGEFDLPGGPWNLMTLLPKAFSSSVMRQITKPNLSHVMEGIAASLTQLGLEHRPDIVFGDAVVPHVQVDVSWRWLALPLLLEVGSVAFVLATAAVSLCSGKELWKSSVLAPIYHGFEEQPISLHLSVARASDMVKAAQMTSVNLKVVFERQPSCLSSVSRVWKLHRSSREQSH